MGLDLTFSRGGVDITLHRALDSHSSDSLVASFDLAVVELRSQLTSLVETEGFELVDGQSGSQGLPSSSSDLGGTPAVGGSSSASGGIEAGIGWGERAEYARLCGEAAARVLAGERGDWPRDLVGLALANPNRHYVLLRDKTGTVPAAGYALYTKWGNIRDQVQVTDSSGKHHISDQAVFKAWPSMQEVKIFLAASRVDSRVQ